MLLEPLFVIVCQGIGNETPGKAQVPCQNALMAGSQQSNTSQTMDELERYSNHFVYKNVNEELIKGLIAAGYLINSYNERIVRAQFPLGKFDFNVNIAINYEQFGIKYKLE